MSEIALSFKNVSKRFFVSDTAERETFWATTRRLLTGEGDYRPLWAMKDLSFDVPKGEILGVIGPNGAGKSTLLLVAAQILSPTEGEVTVNGVTNPFFRLSAGLLPRLTVLENFHYAAALLGIPPARFRQLLPQVVEFSGLEEFLHAKYAELSSGMAARVAFATAVHSDLDIILIDEGLSVGDKAFQLKCRKTLFDLQEQGKTFIVVSHELDSIGGMTDRILYLNKGHAAFIGDPADAVNMMRKDLGLSPEAEAALKVRQKCINDIPATLESWRGAITKDIVHAISEEMAGIKTPVENQVEMLNAAKGELTASVTKMVAAQMEALKKPLDSNLSTMSDSVAQLRKAVGGVEEELTWVKDEISKLDKAGASPKALSPEDVEREYYPAAYNKLLKAMLANFLSISPDRVYFIRFTDFLEVFAKLIELPTKTPLVKGDAIAAVYSPYSKTYWGMIGDNGFVPNFVPMMPDSELMDVSRLQEYCGPRKHGRNGGIMLRLRYGAAPDLEFLEKFSRERDMVLMEHFDWDFPTLFNGRPSVDYADFSFSFATQSKSIVPMVNIVTIVLGPRLASDERAISCLSAYAVPPDRVLTSMNSMLGNMASKVDNYNLYLSFFSKYRDKGWFTWPDDVRCTRKIHSVFPIAFGPKVPFSMQDIKAWRGTHPEFFLDPTEAAMDGTEMFPNIEHEHEVWLDTFNSRFNLPLETALEQIPLWRQFLARYE